MCILLFDFIILIQVNRIGPSTRNLHNSNNEINIAKNTTYTLSFITSKFLSNNNNNKPKRELFPGTRDETRFTNNNNYNTE